MMEQQQEVCQDFMEDNVSKLKTWLEEATTSTPEQRNWKSIEPKLDQANALLAQVAKMVTKGSEDQKRLDVVIKQIKKVKDSLRR